MSKSDKKRFKKSKSIGFHNETVEERVAAAFGGYYDHTTYNSYQHVKCHTGTNNVFVDPVSGVTVKAGGKSRGVVFPKGHLSISLLGRHDSTVTVNGFSPKFFNPEPSISIDWPDYGVPDLTKEDWVNLVKEIRELKKDVIVYCMGGHGRTGTMLCILATMMNAIPGKGDIVKEVRRRYCIEAVESKAQVLYIKAISGANVSETYGDILREEEARELARKQREAQDEKERVERLARWKMEDEERKGRGGSPSLPDFQAIGAENGGFDSRSHGHRKKPVHEMTEEEWAYYCRTQGVFGY